MNIDKNSFLLHKKFKEYFKKLTKEQAGELILAVFEYEESGVEPKLDGVLEFAFIPIRQWLDDKRKEYQKMCEINAKNGQKGGRPKNPTDKAKTEKTEGFSEEPKKAEYDSDSEYDSDDDLNNNGADAPESAPSSPNKPKRKGKPNTEIKYTEDFQTFWNQYPRKVNKLKAFKAWQKIELNDSVYSQIMAGLKRANASPEWQKNIKENTLQFIAHASTWLNGRRWEDETQPSNTGPPSGGGTPSGKHSTVI